MFTRPDHRILLLLLLLTGLACRAPAFGGAPAAANPAQTAPATTVPATTVPDLPVFDLITLPQAPTIDGEPSEEAWSGATTLGPLPLQMNNADPVAKTFVKCFTDGQNLYVAFICEDPEPAHIIAPERARDAAIFGDDTVSIMIQTRPVRSDWVYYHLALSASGVMFDSRVSPAGVDPSWNGRWQGKTKRNDHGWTAEFAVPLTTLCVGDSSYWNINFYREKPNPQELSCWSPTFGPFHTLSRFGKVRRTNDLPGAGRFIERVEVPTPLLGSTNRLNVLFCNKRVGPDTFNFVLTLEDPAMNQFVFTREAAVANQKTDAVAVPYALSVPGLHHYNLEVSDSSSHHVVAAESGTIDFDPLAVRVINRSVWSDEPVRCFVRPGLGLDDASRAEVQLSLASSDRPSIQPQSQPANPRGQWFSLDASKWSNSSCKLVARLLIDHRIVSEKEIPIDVTDRP